MAEPPLQKVAEIAANAGFNLRCQMIATVYAVNVVLIESGATSNHANRVALASKVLSGAVPPSLLARVVLGDPTIQAAAIAYYANMAQAVADVNIDGRLQAIWDALANATL